MQHAFLEGLLPTTKLFFAAAWTCLAGVFGVGSSADSPPSAIEANSFSCELEGPAASLLGTGVELLKVLVDFLKAGFLIGCAGLGVVLEFAEALLGFSMPLEEEVGVPSDDGFLKKEVSVRCLESDPTLEFAFLRDGGGRAGVESVRGIV